MRVEAWGIGLLFSLLLMNSGFAKADWYQEIQVGIGASAVLQGTSGLGSNSDSTDASASIDMEVSYPAGEAGLFLLLLEAGSGGGLDTRVGSIHGLNATADHDPSVRLSEVWYQHSWWNDAAVFRMGMVNPGAAGFDGNLVAGSESEQFLSGAFVNSPVVEFPDNGFGAALKLFLVPGLEIGVVVMDAEASWSGVTGALFTMAEIRLMPGIGNLEGNYRLYGWMNGADHQVIAEPEDEPASNAGFGLSFDQQITGSLSLFCRYGIQDQSVSQLKGAWSAGFQWEGPIGGRPSDLLGFAYGSAMNGDSHIEANPENRWNDESHGEMYYRIAAGDHITLTPDIQWMRNPGGESSPDDLLALGLRMHLAF
jgi:carbohydrate-selective porin OprB